MGQTVEEFFTGYCKAHNLTQVIGCEYSVDENGYCLLSVDCDFEKCIYSKSCDVVKKALAKEDE